MKLKPLLLLFATIGLIEIAPAQPVTENNPTQTETAQSSIESRKDRKKHKKDQPDTSKRTTFFIEDSWAQPDTTLSDTLANSLDQDSLAADTLKKRKGFLRRIYNYFADSNEDKTQTKKLDFSIIGGPHYSSSTKLGLGIVAAGLYRVDRNDLSIPPSTVSLFGDVTTTGFYLLGISGTTLFKSAKYRLNFNTYFFSFPSAFWGIGYDMGRDSTATSMVQKSYQFDAEYQYNILPNTYIGAAVSFSYMNGHKFKRPDYLLGQSAKYTNTGVGVSLQYDSRDFIQNPYKGVYVNLKQMVFPAFMSSSETFWRTTFTADYYQRVWKGGILAFDFYMEYNSGKEVPWCMMAQAGGGYRLRGYYRGRYRDKAMIETQLELRQKIYRRNGIAVWVGAGNVFPKFSQFEWKRTLPDYGIGYRWEFKHRVNIRIDYGRGKHGGFITFNVNEAF